MFQRAADPKFINIGPGCTTFAEPAAHRGLRDETIIQFRINQARDTGHAMTHGIAEGLCGLPQNRTRGRGQMQPLGCGQAVQCCSLAHIQRQWFFGIDVKTGLKTGQIDGEMLVRVGQVQDDSITGLDRKQRREGRKFGYSPMAAKRAHAGWIPVKRAQNADLREGLEGPQIEISDKAATYQSDSRHRCHLFVRFPCLIVLTSPLTQWLYVIIQAWQQFVADRSLLRNVRLGHMLTSG